MDDQERSADMTHKDGDVINALLELEELYPRPTPAGEIPDPISPATRGAVKEQFADSWFAHSERLEKLLRERFPCISHQQIERCVEIAKGFLS
jgi:hypothetical protein